MSPTPDDFGIVDPHAARAIAVEGLEQRVQEPGRPRPRAAPRRARRARPQRGVRGRRWPARPGPIQRSSAAARGQALRLGQPVTVRRGSSTGAAAAGSARAPPRGGPRARGARPRDRPPSVRPARAAVLAHSRAPAARGQVALEQVRGGAGVLVARPAGALGQPRREALVVQLHRDVERSARAAAQTRAPPRACAPVLARRASAAGRRPRAPRPARATSRASAARPLRVSGRSTAANGVASVPVGRRSRSRSGRPVVEGEDARLRPPSARSIAARAVASASGSLSGSRPPACAIVSRPPPPPPATSRRDPHDLARLHSALDRAGAKFATRCTRPSTAVPSTTAASPSALAHGVGQLEQRLRVRRRSPASTTHRHAADLGGAGRRSSSASSAIGPARPASARVTRSLEPLDRRTTSCSGTRSSAASSRRRSRALAEQLDAAGPGDRLDAAHVGRRSSSRP